VRRRRARRRHHHAAAAGGVLDAGTMARIDAALVDPEFGDVIERDPGKIATPFAVRTGWSRTTD
jgi:hypothetical protein